MLMRRMYEENEQMRGNNMETLMKALNEILNQKETEIILLKWENERLEKENAELKNDIEKYKENEANRV